MKVFSQEDFPHVERHKMGPHAVLLREFASAYTEELLASIYSITTCAPFRCMETPGGFKMSVAITNCGKVGWTSDRVGYRYQATDPESGFPWPVMPSAFSRLAKEAGAAGGFANFQPDACIINQYHIGSRLSLHQDKDERDFSAPIVSISLGMSANFLFGGRRRTDFPEAVLLKHGDVVVWGGADRLRYHGVRALKGAAHATLGLKRLNLTFRKAL